MTGGPRYEVAVYEGPGHLLCGGFHSEADARRWIDTYGEENKEYVIERPFGGLSIGQIMDAVLAQGKRGGK